MRRRLLLLCVAVIVAGVVGGRMLTLQPAGVPVAEVTPVALPTFGADVPINSADDSSAPPLGTATPGVAGPTAVVLSSSPWQVLVARGVVPDLTAPTGVAVDAEGNGALIHTATDTKGVWDTGDIVGGGAKSVTFDTAGTYTYNCSPHPWMIGQILVQ